MGTIGEVSAVDTPQKWGQFFWGKGLQNPSLKCYSERAYQIRRWAVLAERG